MCSFSNLPSTILWDTGMFYHNNIISTNTHKKRRMPVRNGTLSGKGFCLTCAGLKSVFSQMLYVRLGLGRTTLSSVNDYFLFSPAKWHVTRGRRFLRVNEWMNESLLHFTVQHWTYSNSKYTLVPVTKFWTCAQNSVSSYRSKLDTSDALLERSFEI